MSYVLGTHSSSSSSSSGLGFINPASITSFGSDLTTALNVFMYGPDQGVSTEERLRRQKAYQLTAPFLLALEAAKVAHGLAGKSNKSLTTEQRTRVLRAVRDAFKQAHALVFPSSGGGGGDVLDTQGAGTEDNTVLYVAGAAGVALLVFGLMRREK